MPDWAITTLVVIICLLITAGIIYWLTTSKKQPNSGPATSAAASAPTAAASQQSNATSSQAGTSKKNWSSFKKECADKFWENLNAIVFGTIAFVIGLYLLYNEWPGEYAYLKPGLGMWGWALVMFCLVIWPVKPKKFIGFACVAYFLILWFNVSDKWERHENGTRAPHHFSQNTSPSVSSNPCPSNQTVTLVEDGWAKKMEVPAYCGIDIWPDPKEPKDFWVKYEDGDSVLVRANEYTHAERTKPAGSLRYRPNIEGDTVRFGIRFRTN